MKKRMPKVKGKRCDRRITAFCAVGDASREEPTKALLKNRPVPREEGHTDLDAFVMTRGFKLGQDVDMEVERL